jgi:hypothetical protein
MNVGGVLMLAGLGAAWEGFYGPRIRNDPKIRYENDIKKY